MRTAARERSRAAKQEKRDAKAAVRAARHDHIVEAPRAPKRSLSQRFGGDPGGGSPSSARRRIASLLGVLLGAVGLSCSIVLALGALLVAQGVDESGSFYESVSGACDVLVGPLRDLITFSGSNAEMKESLVAWGAGSIVYLLIGLVAQALLTSGTDD